MTFLKYWKYIMNKLEKITGIIVLIALAMKYIFLIGGDIILVIAVGVLAVIYYPFGFAFFNNIQLRTIFKKFSYKGISKSRIIGAIGAGIGLSVVSLGSLYTIEHWKGAHLNLYIGLTLTFVVLIISLIKFYKHKDNYYIFIIKRIVIIGGLGLTLLLLPYFTLDKIQYRNYPDYIQAIEKFEKNPESKELKQKLELEYNRVVKTEEGFE